MPAIADRVVREKATKGRARIRWGSVVEKVWKDVGGTEKRYYPQKRWGVTRQKSKSEDINNVERPALRSKVKEAEHLEIYWGLREEIRMKTYLHGPMDYAKTLKLRFRVGDLDLPERRGIPVVEGRKNKTHRCASVAKQQRVQLTRWENAKCTTRNGVC